MRKSLLIAVSLVALAAPPGFAQTPPPLPSSVPRDLAGDPGWQRVEFARNFDPGGTLTPRDIAELRRIAAQRYLARSERRKAEALALAAAVRAGSHLPETASLSIREALKQDLRASREGLSIEHKRWKAERDRWLAPGQPLSAAQWAERRAEWFVFRDNWIMAPRNWAAARRR